MGDGFRGLKGWRRVMFGWFGLWMSSSESWVGGWMWRDGHAVPCRCYWGWGNCR